jgi:hypothetical protein
LPLLGDATTDGAPVNLVAGEGSTPDLSPHVVVRGVPESVTPVPSHGAKSHVTVTVSVASTGEKSFPCGIAGPILAVTVMRFAEYVTPPLRCAAVAATLIPGKTEEIRATPPEALTLENGSVRNRGSNLSVVCGTLYPPNHFPMKDRYPAPCAGGGGEAYPPNQNPNWER